MNLPDIRSLALDESTSIRTTPEVVRAIFDDLESWPQWNTACDSAAWLAGEAWAPGAVFHMTLRMARCPVGFTVRITEHTQQAVAWESTVLSVTGKRRFTFTSDDDTSITRVVDHKDFHSPLLPVRIVYPRPIIQAMSRSWLTSLKNQAESVELEKR